MPEQRKYFNERAKEHARWEELEDNPELKKSLGIKNAYQYGKYFDRDPDYEHVGGQTILNWFKKRYGDKGIENEFDGFLEACRVAGTSGKNSRYADLYATLKGWKQKPKEGTGTNDFTATDRIRIAREVITGLREEYQARGGYCPVCERPQILYEGTRTDSDESETTQDSKVATLELST